MNFDESSKLYPERGSRKSFPVTTSLEKTLIIIVAIAVAVGIGLTICLVNLKKTNDQYLKNSKEDAKICFSPSCVSEASNLIKSMDLSVDPCEDFYSFVCGNWIKNNYLVSSLESQFTKLTRIITLRTKGILEDLLKEKHLPENKQKTIDFYKACMDKAHRKEMGAKELKSDLQKFGGWPVIEEKWNATKFDWVDLMVKLFKAGYINNMFFTVKVETDVKNTSRSLITVNNPSLGLHKREYYILPFEELIKSYKIIIVKLAEHLKTDIDIENSMTAIEEAFKIEDKLAKLSTEIDMKYPDNYYNIFTLQKLEAFSPNIKWKEILQNILPKNVELSNEERIMVTNPSMIKGFNILLGKMKTETGKQTLANYMFYRVVMSAAVHLSTPFNLLVNSLYDPERVNTLLPWETCTKVAMEVFPLPLASSYISKYLDNRTKDELQMMFEGVKNSLIDNIKRAKWLDDKTKDLALLKARKMEAAIAYEDEIMQEKNLDAYYKNVNITDNHFGNIKTMIAFKMQQNMEGIHETSVRFKWTKVDHLLTANAYYRPHENSMIIPVGVLQDTIFAAGRPNYINYGSLGMIVGHELTHAFDSIGSLFDDEGSYKMWWSKESWENFKNKRKCYQEQYNNYFLPVTKSQVNGTLTLGENIADNGGVHTAYCAYKTLLKKVGSEKSLPGLPYNEKQMFWISFASVWCRKQTDDSIQYSIKHSVHTPSKFRVIGSLSNMKEFSEDFNCKFNTSMNPRSRCFLWE